MEARNLPGPSRRLTQERSPALLPNEPHCSRSTLTEDPRDLEDPSADSAYDAESESEHDGGKGKGPPVHSKGQYRERPHASDTRGFKEFQGHGIGTRSRRIPAANTRETEDKPRDKRKVTTERTYVLEGARCTGSRIRNPGLKWGMPHRAHYDEEVEDESQEEEPAPKDLDQVPPRRGQVSYERYTPPKPLWALGDFDSTEDDSSDSDSEDLSGKPAGRDRGQYIGTRYDWDYSLIPTKYGYRSPGNQPCINNYPWRRGYSSRMSRRVADYSPGPYGQVGLGNNPDNYPVNPPPPRPAPAVVVDPEPDLVQRFVALMQHLQNDQDPGAEGTDSDGRDGKKG